MPFNPGDVMIPAADLSCMNWWIQTCYWGHAPIEELAAEDGLDDSACAASGARFPEAGGSWIEIFNDLKRCTTGFNGGRYVKVTWDPEHFLRFWDLGLDASRLPTVFGVCMAGPSRCRDTAFRELIVPLLWSYVDIGGPEKLNHAYFIQKATSLYFGVRLGEHETPGKPVLDDVADTHTSNLTLRAYVEATRERLATVAPSEVSGAVCITGHLRSFTDPAVHGNIRRNVLDSLNFSYRQIVMVTEIGPNDPTAEACPKNHRPSWREAAPGLGAINPDVLLNIHVPIEGHPPGRKCHKLYPLSCNAQWKRLEHCFGRVKRLEAIRGRSFDWIVRIRPDGWYPVPWGDIRTHDPQKLHLHATSYSSMVDSFALIPRRYAETYFSTRFYGGTEYCWDVPRESVRTEDCSHRVHLQLLKYGVPIHRTGIDWAIARRKESLKNPCDPYREQLEIRGKEGVVTN